MGRRYALDLVDLADVRMRSACEAVRDRWRWEGRKYEEIPWRVGDLIDAHYRCHAGPMWALRDSILAVTGYRAEHDLRNCFPWITPEEFHAIEAGLMPVYRGWKGGYFYLRDFIEAALTLRGRPRCPLCGRKLQVDGPRDRDVLDGVGQSPEGRRAFEWPGRWLRRDNKQFLDAFSARARAILRAACSAECATLALRRALGEVLSIEREARSIERLEADIKRARREVQQHKRRKDGEARA